MGRQKEYSLRSWALSQALGWEGCTETDPTRNRATKQKALGHWEVPVELGVVRAGKKSTYLLHPP